MVQFHYKILLLYSLLVVVFAFYSLRFFTTECSFDDLRSQWHCKQCTTTTSFQSWCEKITCYFCGYRCKLNWLCHNCIQVAKSHNLLNKSQQLFPFYRLIFHNLPVNQLISVNHFTLRVWNFFFRNFLFTAWVFYEVHANNGFLWNEVKWK